MHLLYMQQSNQQFASSIQGDFSMIDRKSEENGVAEAVS